MLLSIAAAAAMQGAAPQSAEENSESIIVTGERVKRSLKDTPSSVAVFDKGDLDRMAAPDRIQNILTMVPNVLVVTSRDQPAPVARLVVERNKSTIAFYDYRRRRMEFGFERAF